MKWEFTKLRKQNKEKENEEKSFQECRLIRNQKQNGFTKRIIKNIRNRNKNNQRNENKIKKK